MSGSARTGDEYVLGRFIAAYVDRLLAGPSGLAAAIEDLTLEELHFRPGEVANTIGFDAWHSARTIDSVIHFTFYREQPVWLQQHLDEAWGLPRVGQGTGMDAAEAHALRFPSVEALARYCRNVAAAVVPRLERMTNEFLAEVAPDWQKSERPRLDMIGTSVLTHCYVHLGKIDVARSLLGKPGLGF